MPIAAWTWCASPPAGWPAPKTQAPVAAAAEAWIRRHVRPDYERRGNMRELEQCVHNILTHEHYEADDEAAAPIAAGGPPEESDAWLADGRQGRLTAEKLLQGYCARVYAQTGSYEEAGRQLVVGADPRTKQLFAA